MRRDVDAIWNFAPHDISILNYWLRPHPRAVHCHAYDYLQPGIPDLAFLVLEYERTVAHVHISWLHPSKVRRMTVVGSKKMVVYDDVEGQIVVHDAGIDRERVDRTFPDFETFGEFRLIQRVGDMHIPRHPAGRAARAPVPPLRRLHHGRAPSRSPTSRTPRGSSRCSRRRARRTRTAAHASRSPTYHERRDGHASRSST